MTIASGIYKFSEGYREACFYAWYENKDRPRQKMLDALPADENGRRPGYQTIIQWRDNNGWIERADALDADVSRRVEEELIEKTAKRYEQLALVGEELMKEAVDYIKGTGFDSAASAVRAIGLGGEMMAKYAGMADKIAMLGSMSNRQLEQLAHKLLAQENNKDDDVVNSYAEDVPVKDEQSDDDNDDE